MTCRKCGHTDGMHDERGCVALDCSCGQYLPNTPTQNVSLQANIKRIAHPPRPPLIAPRYAG
jgi:hypothetical protein